MRNGGITDLSWDKKRAKRRKWRQSDFNRIAKLPDGTRMGWLAYMESDAWKAKRREYRQSSRPQECQGCGDLRVEFHHVTYRWLGHEELADLVPVCRECHQAIHDAHKGSHKSLRAVTRRVLKKIKASC